MVSLEKLKQLKELKELLDGNIINEKEFIKLKSELLNEEMDSKEEPNIKNVTRNEESKNDDSEKTQNGEEDHIRNYSWSVIPEPIRVEDESEKWKNLKSKIDEPNSNKTKTSSKTVERKPSINNLPLIVFLAVAGIIGFLIYNNSTSNNETETENSQNTRFTYLTQPVDDLESMSVTSISNEQELYAYLDEVATYWCSEFKKAKKYNNKNRRFEEMLMVDRCINAYPLGFQEGIIMLNDLPMELCSKAREYFQKRVIQLGYEPNWDDNSSVSTSSLEEQIEEHERGSSSEYDEAEYNRQQEQAEYESSQAYYNNEQTKIKPEINKSKAKNTILIPGQIITYLKNDIKYTVELNDENVIEVARFEPANRIDSEGFRVGERRYKMQDDCIVTEFASIKYIIKKEVLIVNDYHNTQTFDFQKSNFK